MGEFVDDIRAALIMNPNFCRIRSRKDEIFIKKNGFIHEETILEDFERNEEIDISLEDDNGNFCFQMEDTGSNSKKVKFMDEVCREIWRRSSDTEIKRDIELGVNKNCWQCSPNGTLSSSYSSIEDDDKITTNIVSSPLKENHSSCYSTSNNINNIEKASSESIFSEANETSSDENKETGSTTNLNSDGFNGKAVQLLPSGDVKQHIPLDDLLEDYSNIIDQNSLELFQKSHQQSIERRKSKSKIDRFKYFILMGFVLIPTLLFYLLIILFCFQPEPLYTSFLSNLKLKDETKEIQTVEYVYLPLSIIISAVKCAISYHKALTDFMEETFLYLINNFVY